MSDYHEGQELEIFVYNLWGRLESDGIAELIRPIDNPDYGHENFDIWTVKFFDGAFEDRNVLLGREIK